MTISIMHASWDNFSAVMGKKGGYGGCWCMLWRLPKKQMDAQMGDANRQAMKAIFESGDRPPGLVAVHHAEGDQPKAVGWIQVAERHRFPRMEASRILKPVDDQPVWSVSCFLIQRPFRKQGLSVQLLEAACDFARAHGAEMIEGYPIDTPKANYPPVYAWTGLYRTFVRAGFIEADRRSPTRPIMRRALTG